MASKLKGDVERLEIIISDASDTFTALTMSSEDGSSETLATSIAACKEVVTAATTELDHLQDKMDKLEVKANDFGTPKQLYNEATSKEILDLVPRFKDVLTSARDLSSKISNFASKLPPPSGNQPDAHMEVDKPDEGPENMDTEPSDPTITISVQMIVSRNKIQVTVPAAATVDGLNTAVANTSGVDIKALLIIFKGKKLVNKDVPIREVGITHGDTVFAGVDPGAKSTSQSVVTANTTTTAAGSGGTSSVTQGRPSTASGSSAAISSSSTAAKTKKDELVASVVDAIKTMKESTNHESLVVGVKTLVKLMDNLLKNPGNEKFGRVREKNPVLSQRLLAKPGGIAALVAAGFEKITENGEVHYVCKNPHPELSAVKGMLDEALATLV